jgi:hypothetical protein
MAKDFKTGQIKTSKIIGKSGEKTVFYTHGEAGSSGDGSTSPDLTGVGDDVSFVFSGAVGDKTTTTGGVTLFTGDLVVSGTLYAENQVIQLDSDAPGGLKISGAVNSSPTAGTAIHIEDSGTLDPHNGWIVWDTGEAKIGESDGHLILHGDNGIHEDSTVLRDNTGVVLDTGSPEAWTSANHIATCADIKSYTDTEVSVVATAVADNDDDILALQTLSGVADEAVDMGTFTGSLLTANQDVKALIQIVGTAIEGNDTDIATNAGAIGTNATNIGTNATAIIANDADIAALQTLSGVADEAVHMGGFLGSLLTADQNVKQLMQEVETEIEGNDTAIGTNATNIGTNATNIGTNATNIGKLSTTNTSEGASLIGIEDSGSNFTATDVEGALAAVATAVSGSMSSFDIDDGTVSTTITDGNVLDVRGGDGLKAVVSAPAGAKQIDINHDITSLTNRPTPAAGDYLIIEDNSGVSPVIKKVDWSSLPSAGGGGDMTGVDLTAGVGISIDSETNTTSGDYSATITCNLEGSEVASAGEGGTTKFLRTDGDGTCSWQVPSYIANTDTTYSAMSTSALGLGKIKYALDAATPAAESQSTTASRTYGVTKNTSDQLVVNVPWTGGGGSSAGVTPGIVQISDGSGGFDAASVLKYHPAALSVNWADSQLSLSSGGAVTSPDARFEIQNKHDDDFNCLVLKQLLDPDTVANARSNMMAILIESNTDDVTSDVAIANKGNIGEIKLANTFVATPSGPTFKSTQILMDGDNFKIVNNQANAITEIIGISQGLSAPEVEYNIVRGESNAAGKPCVTILADPTSPPPAALASDDINFYVEGTAGSLGSAVNKKSAQFGGDVKVDGFVSRGGILHLSNGPGTPQSYDIPSTPYNGLNTSDPSSIGTGGYTTALNPAWVQSVIWNTSIISDPIFYTWTASSADITIEKAGTYKISYTVNLSQIQPPLNRVNMRTFLRKTTGSASVLDTINCSEAWSYGRGSGAADTVSKLSNVCTTTAILAVNDVINLNMLFLHGTRETEVELNVRADQTWILIERIA